MLHVYERTLHWVAAPPPRHARLLALVLVGTVVAVHDHAEGLSAQRGHRPDLRVHRGGAGISFEAMVEHQQRGRRRSSRRIRTSSGFMSSVGGGGGGAGNTGHALHQAQAARAARRPADEIIARAATEARADPGHARLPAEPAADPHRRPRRRRPVPVHAAGADIDELYPRRATLERRCAQHAGVHGRHERPAAQEPAGSSRRSTATARRAWA